LARPTKPSKDQGIVYTPRNDRQRLIRTIWPQTRLLVVTGPAGTGKTTAALGEALLDVFAGRGERVMLARPVVAVEEELGFLPGGLAEKLGPWLAPFSDVLGDLTADTLDKLKGKWEPVPVGMLRGRTISRGTLIIDEAQNCSWNQLVCAGSRVGRGGRVVLCGDPDQSDLGCDPHEVPLLRLAKKVRKVLGVAWVECTHADQVRDEFVTAFLKAIG
jgi:phosphate starvation-inducible PhoH-like protein